MDKRKGTKGQPATSSTVSLTIAGRTYTATAATRNEALVLLDRQVEAAWTAQAIRTAPASFYASGWDEEGN